MSIGLKDLIRGGLISVAVASGFFAVFAAAAFYLPYDQQAVRRNVIGAVLDGTFNVKPSYGPLGHFAWPRHTLDCAVGSMLVAPPAGRLVDAMSNRIPAVNPAWRDARVPDTLDCQAFARAIPELGPGYGDVTWVSFDRYILGIRVIVRSMLSVMTLDTAARMMRGIAFALLGTMAALALWTFAHAAPDARGVPAAYIVIAACLALLYGVHFFDATMLFSFPDYTQFIFIIVSLLVPLAKMRPPQLALYAACYGSLIAIFETLTGGIPFALAILPLLLALGFAGGRRDYIGKVILLWTCFSVAVIASFAIKKAFTAAFIENQDSFLFYLFYRMYGQVPAATGTELSLGYILSAYRRWSGLLAFGSANVGTGLILASLGVFAVHTWRLRKTPWSPQTAILAACWLSVLALIMWACAFLNHTAVHPYYMARVLVVPVTAAAVLLTMWILRPRGTPATSRVAGP